MRIITKADIVGAKIIDIHSTSESINDCDCTMIYFTVDRGFSFNMPEPQFEWQTAEIPLAAKRLPDEFIEDSFRLEGNWPSIKVIREAPNKIDVVKRIKARKIQGVYCPRMDDKLGFYLPDSSLLIFDDGSQGFCVIAAPHGLGTTGLHFRTDIDNLPKTDDLIDFFKIPVTRDDADT